MGAPIGSKADGFGGRLVLERRSGLAVWGERLLLLLLVPFPLMAVTFPICLVAARLAQFYDGKTDFTFVFFFIPVVLVLGTVLVMLWDEFATRNFRELSLVGAELEADGLKLDLVDLKVWPSGITVTARSGGRWHARTVSTDKLLTVTGQVLPGLVLARRQELEAAGELQLDRDWWPLLAAVWRGLLYGLLVLLTGNLFHPLLGLVAGAIVAGLTMLATVRDFWGAGLVLSQTGIRRIGQPSTQEVPWSEVDCFGVASYFQDRLRITTTQGIFTLVSSRNPLVWARLIQELRTAEP